nr:hypothetical protein [Megavirus caiporensis]
MISIFMSKGQTIKNLYGVILANLQDTSQTALYVASRPNKVEKIPDFDLTINIHKRNRSHKSVINSNKIVKSKNINLDCNKKKSTQNYNSRSKCGPRHRIEYKSKNNYKRRSKQCVNYKSKRRSKRRSKRIYKYNSKRNSNCNIKKNAKKIYTNKINRETYEGYYF